MLRLNDDCLCRILQYLNLKDQLTATAVSLRFQGIIVTMIWKVKFRVLSTNSARTSDLPSEDYKNFFIMNVANIEKLTMETTNQYAFSSYLGRYKFRPEFLFYLNFNYPKLSVLNIQEPRLHDGHLRLVAERCPHLEVLRISSETVTGAYIKDMTRLRELHAIACSISATYLSEINNNLKLKHLNLTENTSYTDWIGELAHSNAEELTVSEAGIDVRVFESTRCKENLKILRLVRFFDDGRLVKNPLSKTSWIQLLNKIGGLIFQMKLICSYVYTWKSSPGIDIWQAAHLFSNLSKFHLTVRDDAQNDNAQAVKCARTNLLDRLMRFIEFCHSLEYIEINLFNQCDDLMLWCYKIFQIFSRQPGRKPLIIKTFSTSGSSHCYQITQTGATYLQETEVNYHFSDTNALNYRNSLEFFF